MEGDKSSLGCDACQGKYKLLDANLKIMCVSVMQLSNTELCLLMDFTNDDSMFTVIMAQVMRDITSTTVGTREQKKIG